MVENLGRKLILIAVLVTAALALLLVPDKPFRLGLDLSGGTRLVYSFDIEKMIEEGIIEAGDKNTFLQQSLTIIRNRVDPDGVLEPIIRQEGSNRIVVELPGTQEVSQEQAEAGLTRALQVASTTIELDPAKAEPFPKSGGTVYVGGERMRYARRAENVLLEVSRGSGGTLATEHAIGETVSLASTDAIRNRIENLGDLKFFIIASEADLAGSGTDVTTEREKLETWYAENSKRPGFQITDFNRVPVEEGGPNAKVRWYPHRNETGVEVDPLLRVGQYPVLIQDDPDWRFAGEDLENTYQTIDPLGYPAVGFRFKDARKGDFTDFTEENVNRNMAIVLNGEIEVAPTINDTLPGSGIIQGQYKHEEVAELITVLRSGSLKIRPTLEADERVGPSLGADYVNRGKYSALASLGAVLVFMAVYYRRLGLFACVSLLASLLLLMGGLVLINATLTLPGIAGIILTIGMAVDANILIFDRVREEMDSGRNVMQAAKNGFDRALVTIVDANLTTLITSIVLYQVGTGPVRGFAVTLSVGVLTSMFAALVITRVLVHLQLQKGKRVFNMGTWLVKANWKFINKSRIAFTGSSIAVLLGLVLFVAMPDEEKLGIDFLGGWRVQVRTEAPQDVDTMRDLIKAAPGVIGEHAEVKSVGAGDGLAKNFVITFKGGGEGDEMNTFESDIRGALGDTLQRGPIEIREDAGGASQLALYFEEAHKAEDVQTVLATLGLENPTVTTNPADPTRFIVGTTGGITDEVQMRGSIEKAFATTTDSTSTPFKLALPFPGSSLVGAQVVGELRDQALLAVAFSLFAIVMYIRIRFSEYSYGFAAVFALLHDVLITLGAIAIVIKTGLVDLEVDLPLIAAFLTIIGYSLNDTIVMFDRVRENLPRMKNKPLDEVLDLSINQTLSRTVLTSLTTLMAVMIMFVWNLPTGNVLVGFSFSMVIGVIVGTYSSIYIAAPILVWFEERRIKRENRAEAGGSTSKKPAAA